MALDNIIEGLKSPKEEMSATSFNIPLKLKEQLSKIAKDNNFTVNAFLVAMIDNVLNGELREKSNLELVEKLENLLARKKEIELKYENEELAYRAKVESSGNFEIDPSSFENYDEDNEELENIKFMIKVLKER